uniref:BED-type domain-containing protein n=1 Tax=Cuerna arida TaxID=1464854 RepID=A0A1B6ESL4_9HEMI
MSDNEDIEQNVESEVERSTSELVASEQYYESQEVFYDKKRKERQKYSAVWSKFTILDNERSIASCNVCGHKLSFKTSVSNLRKHIERKHKYNSRTFTYSPYGSKTKISPTRKPNLSELGGLDGLILNVVADEGEDPLGLEEQQLEANVVYQSKDGHDYCVVSEEIDGQNLQQTADETQRIVNSQSSTREKIKQVHLPTEHPSRPLSCISDRSERVKKNRIMDLQLECLEIKKYNMQMEALVLEHQLSLPRSIFTQPLQNSDTISRGTQTDVGGNNTKVFFVSDSRMLKEGSHHLLSFQAMLND